MTFDRPQENLRAFIDTFDSTKKIALYGTGRRTKSMLDGLKKSGLQIVGVLDQNPDSIGKTIGDIKIISLKDANEIAECIIINTAEIYWYIVYRRIENDCKIPIYLLNGIEAKEYFGEFSSDEIIYLCDKNTKHIGFLINKYLKTRNFDRVVNKWQDWGYCIWGPVAWIYVCWLHQMAKRDNCCQLIFLARDGYLLKKAYELFGNVTGLNILPSIYVLASRRLTFFASIGNDEDFEEYVSHYFYGTFGKYLRTRFDIHPDGEDELQNELISIPKDIAVLKKYLLPYRQRILSELDKEKDSYCSYLKGLGIDNHCGIIDTGFTGKIPYCLSKLLEVGDSTSYYFYGDISSENKYGKSMRVCFQEKNDVYAKNCNLRKYVFFVESIFTAPHGTAIKMDSSTIVYGDEIHDFNINNMIFEGIKCFFKDVAPYYQEGLDYENMALKIDCIFLYLMTHLPLNIDLQENICWEDSWSG